jgi:SAM-dependent methyltransferase
LASQRPNLISELIEHPGFQPPRYIDDLSDCIFYHSMELPGLGLQSGSWDLRDDVDNYLGRQIYSGKRVVDVGAASGYLSFEMEKRGAAVVGLDRLVTVPLDEMGLVPFADFEERFGSSFEHTIESRMDFHRKLQNSFWMAHRLLNSRVTLYCGTAYDCPSTIGEFDYAFFGSILLHLRDPLQALASFGRAAREKIIITEPWENVAVIEDVPAMFLRPNVYDNTNPGTWWYMTPTLLQRFVEILGFREVETFQHEGIWVADQRPVKLFTLVGSRR